MAARSFSNAKFISALADGLSVAVNRRGFSAMASQGVATSMARGGIVKQVEERGMKKERSETSPWVPDPVTGYYRPENQAAEIDVAELREMLLNNKMRQN